jgi:anaerobic selenocysteine-containing dehydrogenase
MLEDEERVGCHVALTPIWSETAQWADWVLPMGLGPERHDLMSQETHAGTWIGFRQPVRREFRRLETGQPVESTLGTNPGEVWEEAEFWIALSFRIDPDGSLGIRKWFESRARPGEPRGLEEYYADIFENGVPGLPAAASEAGLSPLEYMRRFGAFAVPYAGRERYAKEGPSLAKEAAASIDGRAGFPTPSGRLEVFSKTLRDWGHAEQALPGYIRSHVHWRELDAGRDEMVLLPTFRLPTLIHTRSGNAKWLQEISHTNPLWVHPSDAERIGLANGELARVRTAIGWFVPRVWVTEGIHPGIVACSHHVGRWRLRHDVGGDRLSTSWVDIRRGTRSFLFRQKQGVQAFDSPDEDTRRVWWNETGVNQNLTFPVQPDPVSGMHCWHQKVVVEAGHDEDRYADVFVDTAAAQTVYEDWLARVVPAPGPGGLRRPLWLNRPLHPTKDSYRLKNE